MHLNIPFVIQGFDVCLRLGVRVILVQISNSLFKVKIKRCTVSFINTVHLHRSLKVLDSGQYYLGHCQES